MSDIVVDFLILLAILAPMAAFVVGRIFERRMWKEQRSVLHGSLEQIMYSLIETDAALEQSLEISRTQRELLQTMTSAAEEIEIEGGPLSEARHRLAWAAQRSRNELL